MTTEQNHPLDAHLGSVADGDSYGLRLRATDALVTNFHLPRTTLLVLVRTFGGDELVMQAYEEAVREKYRFYSYGDATLILPVSGRAQPVEKS